MSNNRSSTIFILRYLFDLEPKNLLWYSQAPRAGFTDVIIYKPLAIKQIFIIILDTISYLCILNIVVPISTFSLATDRQLSSISN